MESYGTSSHSPFRSRRSHPTLNHISLAPLTPRFPIDDLPEQGDYFQHSLGQSTSYLSSSSVPSTPPILSHSRASSRTRHHKRSRSSNFVLSDTNLRSLGAQKALSQHPHPHQHQHGQSGSNKSGLHTPGAAKKKTSDSEWLLRAGLALTSSTREEKGQSWLVKRESSTSLVADSDPDMTRTTTTRHHHHQRGRSTPFRSGRSSGVSTPGQYSRRSSISRETGRYASRADFGMTSLDVEQHNGGESRQSRKSSVGSYHVTLPDFVDAKIRAELASIDGRARDGCYENDYDNENPHMSDSLSMDSDADSDDELDETEFQRLTREQGFGLGTWVDQFVSWTLFGVEEDISTSPPPPLPLLPSVSQEGSDRQTTVGFEPIDTDTDINAKQKESVGDDDSSDSAEQDEISGVVERAGDKGGWADASWFLRLARNAII